MAFGDIDASLGGETIGSFFECCLDGGPAPLMLGFNCSVGPKADAGLRGKLYPRAPAVLVMPNAVGPSTSTTACST
jgi:methionine synthase I (cobalamin-dependent)